MPSEEEAQRIAQVYHHYQNDAAIRAQWRADNPGNRAILGERRRVMRDALQRAGLWPLAGRRVLDVGWGSGRVLAG